MYSEMVAMVARAIQDKVAWTDKTDLIKAAKAAIQAMREPTQSMLDAGAYDLDMTLEMQWHRMIDAALK